MRTQSFGAWSILGAGVALALGALGLILSRIDRLFRARNLFERFILAMLIACALIAILTTVGIIFSVATETWRFFFDPSIKGKPTLLGFLFGTDWNPQSALRADQGEIQTAYGFIPLLVGTLLITFIAMCVAGPIGLMSAIYLSEYASPPRAGVLQAGAGDPGRHPHGGARLLRRPHHCAAHSRLGRVAPVSTSPPRARWRPASSWA